MEVRMKLLEERNVHLERDVKELKLQLLVSTKAVDGEETIKVLPSVKVKNRFQVLSQNNEPDRHNTDQNKSGQKKPVPRPQS